MHITQITVTAARTFNHPHESYSNLRPSVSMVATLAEGEDAGEATRVLQAKAESLVEEHKRSLLKSIEELHELTETSTELVNIEGQLRRLQARAQDIRAQHPQLALETAGGQS